MSAAGIKRKEPSSPKSPSPKSPFPTSKRARSAAPNTTEMDESTTPLAKLIFGHEAVNNLLKEGISTRKIWELSNPTTQCNNIIGPSGKTKCWICQMPIGKTGGLQPECEHILPIAQAVLYLGLYTSEWEKKHGTNINSGITHDQLQLEYGWAHQVCNQTKSDKVYITIDRFSKFKVDEVAINGLINSIWKTGRKGSDIFKTALHKLYNNDMGQFIKAAQHKIVERYNAICEYLNSTGGGANLHLLAGMVSAAYGIVRKGMVRKSNSTEIVDNYGLELLSTVSIISNDYDKLIANHIDILKSHDDLRKFYIAEATRIKPLYIKLIYSHNSKIIDKINSYIIVQLYGGVIKRAEADKDKVRGGYRYILVSLGTHIKRINSENPELFKLFDDEKEAYINDIAKDNAPLPNASSPNTPPSNAPLPNDGSEILDEEVSAINALMDGVVANALLTIKHSGYTIYREEESAAGGNNAGNTVMNVARGGLNGVRNSNTRKGGRRKRNTRRKTRK